MASTPPPFRFQILGPIECHGAEQRVELSGRPLELLAMLLVHSDRLVSTGELIDALPADEPDVPGAIVRLRAALAACGGGPPVLVTIGDAHRLHVGRRELDADAFTERVQQGCRALGCGEPVIASEFLASALAMWRGPALAEVAHAPFAQAEIRRLDELRRTALEAGDEADRRCGRLAASFDAGPPAAGARAFLVLAPGHRRQRVVRLDPARQLTVGRAASADVALAWDPMVSRLHALLERAGDAWAIADDGLSSNGTFCNGERVDGVRELEDGDLLRLGGTTILFRDPARAPGDRTAAEPAYGIVNGAERPSRWSARRLATNSS